MFGIPAQNHAPLSGAYQCHPSASWHHQPKRCRSGWKMTSRTWCYLSRISNVSWKSQCIMSVKWNWDITMSLNSIIMLFRVFSDIMMFHVCLNDIIISQFHLTDIIHWLFLETLLILESQHQVRPVIFHPDRHRSGWWCQDALGCHWYAQLNGAWFCAGIPNIVPTWAI